jgi:hypothetical protein
MDPRKSPPAFGVSSALICEILRVPTTHDALTENLAKLVIEQARTGERNPDKLCAMTLKALAYRR